MLKQLRNSNWFKRLTNKYLLTGIPFIIWMLFFDANSWLIQKELNMQIDKLQQSIQFYSSELETDRVALEELESDPKAFEKYARERFWMHKPGEEVYVFEFEKE